MAFEAPLWQQTGSYSAAEDRKMIAAIQSEGVDATTNSLKVTQRAAGVNMSVDVAIGGAFVTQGQLATSPARRYFCYNSAIYNATIPTASGTAGQSRNDLVGIQVRDTTVDGGSNDDWYIRVVSGTPATTGAQVDPAEPDSFYPLARVTVVYNATAISNSNITDLRSRSFTPNLLSSDWTWTGTQNIDKLTIPGSNFLAPSYRPLIGDLLGGVGRIATADAATDVITTSTPHNLAVGTYVSFTGGTATGVTAGQMYRIKTAPTTSTLTLQPMTTTGTVDITGTGTLGTMDAQPAVGVYSGVTVAANTASEGTAGSTRVFVQFTAPLSGRARVRMRTMINQNVAGSVQINAIQAVGMYVWNGTSESNATGLVTNWNRTRTAPYASAPYYIEGYPENYVLAFPANEYIGYPVQTGTTFGPGMTPVAEFNFDNLTPGTIYRAVALVGVRSTSNSSSTYVYPGITVELLP